MNRIERTFYIAAPPEEVWRALTDPVVIQKWSQAPAQFQAEPDTEYSLWAGEIGGRVLEAVPAKKLAQTWKPKNWERDDSVVTFTLSPAEGGTVLDLVHENIEDWDYEGTHEGWDIYYVGVIKDMLEADDVERMEESDLPAPEAPSPSRKAAVKKAAAKKAVAKKAATKKPAAKNSEAKKSTTRKGGTSRKAATTRKGAAKKGAVKKSARKTPTRKGRPTTE